MIDIALVILILAGSFWLIGLAVRSLAESYESLVDASKVKFEIEYYRKHDLKPPSNPYS